MVFFFDHVCNSLHSGFKHIRDKQDGIHHRLTILSSVGYAYFFGTGSQTMPYPVLAVISCALSVVASIIVQICILQTTQVTAVHAVGAGAMVVGVVIIICREHIQSIVK
jgi:hypothetical protein